MPAASEVIDEPGIRLPHSRRSGGAAAGAVPSPVPLRAGEGGVPPARTARPEEVGSAVEADKGTEGARRAYSLEHALAALGPGEHSLSEIAEAAKVRKPTAYRSLTAGCELGIFLRTRHGRYILGDAAAQIGLLAMHGYSDEDLTHGALEALFQRTKETALLFAAAPFGPSVACRDYVAGHRRGEEFMRQLLAPSQIAVAQSLRVGAPGRVVLANLHPTLRSAIIAQPVPRGAGPGALTARNLEEAVEFTRANGFALARQEVMASWDTLAMPITVGGTVIGAVALAAPESFMHKRFSEFLAAVRAAAHTISDVKATQLGAA